MLLKIIRRFYRSAVILASLTCAPALLHAGDIYQAKLSVIKDGVVISKPSIAVEANKQAELTITPQGASSDSSIRLLVTIKPALIKPDGANVSVGKEVAEVNVLIFDKVNGEWTLRSQPEVTADLDKEIILSVSPRGLKRSASALDATILIHKMNNGKTPSAACDPGLLKNDNSLIKPSLPSTHIPEMARLFTKSKISSFCGVDKCCSNGSLRCCNTVCCCDGVSGLCCS